MQDDYPRVHVGLGKDLRVRHVDDHPDARGVEYVPPEGGPVCGCRVLVRGDKGDVPAVPYLCKGPLDEQHVRVVLPRCAGVLPGEPGLCDGAQAPVADVRRVADHCVELFGEAQVPRERVGLDARPHPPVHQRVSQPDRLVDVGQPPVPPHLAQEQVQARPLHSSAVQIDPEHVLLDRPDGHAPQHLAGGRRGGPAGAPPGSAPGRLFAPYGGDRPHAPYQERPRPARRIAHADRVGVLPVLDEVPHQHVHHKADYAAGGIVYPARLAVRRPALAARRAPRGYGPQVLLVYAAEHVDVEDGKVVPLHLVGRRVEHVDHAGKRIVRYVQAVAGVGRKQACVVNAVESAKRPAQPVADRHVPAPAAPGSPPRCRRPLFRIPCQRHEDRLGHAPVLERPHEH